LDWLVSGALAEIDTSAGEDDAYVHVPATAAAFGQRRYKVSPLRAVVEADVALLHLFGSRSRRRGVTEQFDHFARQVAGEIRLRGGRLDTYMPILEAAARWRPPLWLLVADLLDAFGNSWAEADNEAEAVRNYLEHFPEDGDAWQRLAKLYGRTGDRFAQVTALIERAELESTPFLDIGYAAARLLGVLADGEGEAYGPGAQEWLIERLVSVMQRRSGEAESKDFSRLAWLCLHQSDEDAARRWAQVALERDPDNQHAQRILVRLGANRRADPSVTVPPPGSGEKTTQTKRVEQIVASLGHSPEPPLTLDDVRDRINLLVEALLKDSHFGREMATVGVPFATVGWMINASLPGLHPPSFGFRNLSRLTEQCLTDSSLALAVVDGHPRLFRRDVIEDQLTLDEQVEPQTYRKSVEARLWPLVEEHARTEPLTAVADVEAAVLPLIRALVQDAELADRLRSEGLPFALVASFIKRAVPALNPIGLGFRNLSALVHHVLKDTEFDMAERVDDSAALPWLVLRDNNPPGMLARATPEPRDPHSHDYYAEVLGTGPPMIKPPPPADLGAIAGAVREVADGPQPLGDWLAQVSHELAPGVPEQRVKAGLLTMVATDVFLRSPVGRPLREQDLALREEAADASAILERVRTAAEEKLKSALGAGDEGALRHAVLDEILPAT
jgi:tetratricopeptide (TPR) repeat protein